MAIDHVTTVAGVPVDPNAPVNPITKEKVQKLCVEQGFYKTPSCNEKLYLHHKGFDQISGLDEFSEAKVLWLEGNCFAKIEGLGNLTKLRQLYLHQNHISRVEGLETLAELDGLNLSDNGIAFLTGLDSQADSLTMLQLKNNRLATIDGLEHLLVLNKLSSLDLTGNRIEDGEALLTLLAQLPSLKSLHLTGNPCVRTISNYRKRVLSRLPNLMYLDEKPVFKEERRLVTAWTEGGLEAEREEKKKMREEEMAAIQQRLQEFRDMQRRGREARGEDATRSSSSEEENDSNPTGSDNDDGDVWVPGSASNTNTAAAQSASEAPSEPGDVSDTSSQQGN
jgi:dynein assembly factor 1